MTYDVIYLSLMRHAKSSWRDGSLTDHQRPLNDRGRKAAPKVGAALHARGYAPDIIWSSDSKRTRETAMHLIRAIPGAQEVHYNSELYHASPDDVLRVCDKEDPPQANLMLLGHNPGWSTLYSLMTGESHTFPTAACAVFKNQTELSQNWLRPENWKLVDLILPRELDE